MFASGVRNNFPQVCFPRVANWRVARFFMFVRQFNDFCELLSRIFRNARQRNVFLVCLGHFFDGCAKWHRRVCFFTVFAQQFLLWPFLRATKPSQRGWNLTSVGHAMDARDNTSIIMIWHLEHVFFFMFLPIPHHQHISPQQMYLIGVLKVCSGTQCQYSHCQWVRWLTLY